MLDRCDGARAMPIPGRRPSCVRSSHPSIPRAHGFPRPIPGKRSHGHGKTRPDRGSGEERMPHEIHERNEVRALIDGGAQVVEVLGPEEFEEDHLPGAINLPLRRIEREARTRLDPARPVVVYCWDSA